jgi:hypothetical protein
MMDERSDQEVEDTGFVVGRTEVDELVCEARHEETELRIDLDHARCDLSLREFRSAVVQVAVRERERGTRLEQWKHEVELVKIGFVFLLQVLHDSLHVRFTTIQVAPDLGLSDDPSFFQERE